jgi:GTP-binding protein
MNEINKNYPLVVIFGRTNVGKSTLFNRLIGEGRALVSGIEGTTRDANVGEVEWRGKKFELIDTGGIIDLKYLTGKVKESGDIEEKVQGQAREILKRADLILFTVDAISGLLPQDRQMADWLKKNNTDGKKIILTANKADNQKRQREISEFYKLSLGEPAAVSAITGSGTGDLLDIIIKKLRGVKKPRVKKIADKEEIIKVSIIGKPNVGKSSLLNAILGEKRVIVSPIAHTTREPQDTLLSYKEKTIRLIDTAGISRKGAPKSKTDKYREIKTEDDLIKRGIEKSLGCLKRSDIVLFVIDISEPLVRQDLRVLEEIVERRKSLIIIANKWDKIAKRDTKVWTRYINGKIPFTRWAPLQFISAKSGEKINKIMDIVLEINEARKKVVSEKELKEFLGRLVKMHRPSRGKGYLYPRVYKLIQKKTSPPLFELFIGAGEDLHYSYIKFIENRLREKFDFKGTPINIETAKKKK